MDVTVKGTGLLLFMLGPRDTTSGPEVAPEGITIVIAVAPHELIVAATSFGMADKNKAFAYLEEALADRSSWLIWLRVEPTFDLLRSDPRFAALLL